MTEQSDIRLKRQVELPSGDGTIDPLDFMRRTGPCKTLIEPQSATNREANRQSYLEPFNSGGSGRFYYVKNIVRRGELVLDQYERWGWNDDSVWIERDTGWGDGGPQSNSFDATEYGDRWWARRPSVIGEAPVYRSARIEAFHSKNSFTPPGFPRCQYNGAGYKADDGQRVAREFRAYGGDICPNGEKLESIGIWQYNQARVLVEIFWYARGWGWVEWNSLRPGQELTRRWNMFGDRQPLEADWKCEGLGQAPGSYQAEYYFLDPEGKLEANPPDPLPAGEFQPYRMKVRNTGGKAWFATDNMRLMVELTDPFDPGDRTEWVVGLPSIVEVGEQVFIDLSIRALEPKLYMLTHRLIRSGDIPLEQVHTRLVQAVPGVWPPPFQLAMLVDTTGSMFDDIDAVRQASTEIVHALTLYGVAVAVADYKDCPEAPYGDPGDYVYHAVMPFATNASNVVRGIEALSVGGGGPTTRESVLSGLMHTIDGWTLGGWVESAERRILVIADAAGHDPEPFTGYTAQSVIDAAGWGASEPALLAESGMAINTPSDAERVAIYSVVVGNDADAIGWFTRLSAVTGGKVFRAEGPGDIAKAILDAIDDAVPVVRPGNTYRVGVLGSHPLYRTNVLRESAALTCRYAQISPAVYNEERNRTYIAYTAGRDGVDPEGRPFTAENPWIIAFDHSTESWQGPVEIADVRPRKPRRDCHDYPQILIDSEGYLHVFHTFHITGPNIQHFKSRAPHDISDPWVRSEIPGTKANTYGAAFKSKEGHFYVFYRDTVWHQQASEGVPVSWYEPQMYVKSTDEGRTWSDPRLLIDPGRPSASSASDRARQVTSLINDNGWNTVYASNWVQDHARNRLFIDFTSTLQHGEQWGNRIVVCFDMYHDEVLTMKGTSLGSRIDRLEYLTNQSEGVRVYTGRFVSKYMDAYGHALSQSIVIEDEDHGYPTVYYVWFESNNPELGPDHEGFYQSGWDRLRRARWTGWCWDDDYVSGVADPAADPFIQWDDLTQRRRETSAIWAAEYRGDDGTFLYVKTKWGGIPFWLDDRGGRRPEYDWDPKYDYQFPGRVFSTKRPFTTHVRMFGDHRPWEVRGIANFNLVPGGHPTIKAFLRVPKYTKLTPTTGGLGVLDQYAIGADYVFGDEPLQPLRLGHELPGDEEPDETPRDSAAQLAKGTFGDESDPP